MKQSRIVYRTLAVTIIISGLLGCKPDATPQAKEGEKWLTGFYKHYSIRGDWVFFGVTAKDSDVRVVINIPDQQAIDLAALGHDEEINFIVSNACPPITEGIWSILEAQGDVIIDARSRGRVVATITCRTKKGGLP